MDQVEFSDLGGVVKWDHNFGKSFGKFFFFLNKANFVLLNNEHFFQNVP